MTKSLAMIVAGEVGSHETRLALCGLDLGRPVVLVDETAPNPEGSGLTAMVQAFLRKYRPPQIRAAAFVAGGPVYGAGSFAADVPWAADGGALAGELGIDKVTILTDAEAVAHAIAGLAPEDTIGIGGSDAGADANQLVVSIGANPSVAALYWDGTEHRPFASDAGHADFSPANEEELRLALSASGAGRGARVTTGLLLSRVGLALVHRFVLGLESPPSLPVLPGEDAAAAILRAANAGTDRAARRAVDLYLAICASTAGNLALTLRASGGVYLTGDVVPALRASLGGGVFPDAFGRKTPREAALRDVPVRAVVNPRAALLGAATVAARALRARPGGGWAS
jgi:glucokinase